MGELRHRQFPAESHVLAGLGWDPSPRPHCALSGEPRVKLRDPHSLGPAAQKPSLNMTTAGPMKEDRGTAPVVCVIGAPAPPPGGRALVPGTCHNPLCSAVSGQGEHSRTGESQMGLPLAAVDLVRLQTWGRGLQAAQLPRSPAVHSHVPFLPPAHPPSPAAPWGPEPGRGPQHPGCTGTLGPHACHPQRRSEPHCPAA